MSSSPLALSDGFKVHPVAEMFPMMTEEELDELAEDIKQNGQLLPIIVKDGLIIDGRNRLEACRRAGVEAEYQELGGQDSIGLIFSANVERRHLTPSQRAMASVIIRAEQNAEALDKYIKAHGGTREQAKKALGDLAKVKKSLRKDDDDSIIMLSSRDAAKQAKVDQAYIMRAAFVYENTPLAVPAVMSGDLWLNQAFEKAQNEITERNSIENRMANLRAEAPDLATLVDEQKMTLSEAKAALDQRKDDLRKKAQRAAELLSQLVITLDPRTKTPDDHAKLLIENFQQSVCVEELTTARWKQCAAVMKSIVAIWKDEVNAQL